MPLHKELAEALDHIDADTTIIRHPLVQTLYGGPHMDNILNNALLYKQKQVAAALAGGHVDRYLVLHERPYRLQALVRMIDSGQLSRPKHYWEIVAKEWQSSENIFENLDAWKRIWTADVPRREHAMSKHDRERLQRLPPEITLYRGYQGASHALGLSWSWERATAEWFAGRFLSFKDEPAGIMMGVARRDDVLACFASSENEIVIMPDKLKCVQCDTIPAKTIARSKLVRT